MYNVNNVYIKMSEGGSGKIRIFFQEFQSEEGVFGFGELFFLGGKIDTPCFAVRFVKIETSS